VFKKDKIAKDETVKKAGSKAIKKHNDKMEKTTLGDLDVLSSLKDQMEQGENK